MEVSKVSAAAWSRPYRPAASYERLRQLAAYGATTAYIGRVGLPLAPLGWAIAVAFEIGGGVLWFLVFVRGRSRSV